MLVSLRNDQIEPEELTTLLERLFAHDPKWVDGAPVSFIQDWIQALVWKPRAFCWMAFDYFIHSKGKWAPGLGDFLAVVEGYERANDLILEELGHAG